MLSAPWILLAVGILIIIVGLVIAMMTPGGGGYIDERMSDKEIKRRLKEAEGNPIGGWIMTVGVVIVLGSLVWRIVLRFVRM